VGLASSSQNSIKPGESSEDATAGIKWIPNVDLAKLTSSLYSCDP